MRSNYKRLGDYISPVDVRNKDLAIDRLLGVSISKTFIESIANTVGTDFSNYKVVKRNQFAYGPVTSRNGDKISVALLNEDECIISSSYSVFKVNDEKQLLPDYLMLWFNRPEFDRYARYMSHGSVREIFSWDDMCNVELPVPSIEEQNEFVDAYKAIENRIALKKKINDNLESTLGTLYHEFFTCSSTDDLPDGWRVSTFSDIATVIMGQSPDGDDCNNDSVGEPLLNGPTEFGVYSPTPVQWTTNGKKHCKEGDLLFCVRGSTTGRMNWANQPYVIGRGLAAIRHKTNTNLNWIIKAIVDNNMQELLAASTGSTFPNVGKDLLNGFQIIIPDDASLNKFENQGHSISQLISKNAREMEMLSKLHQTLLSKLST